MNEMSNKDNLIDLSKKIALQCERVRGAIYSRVALSDPAELTDDVVHDYRIVLSELRRIDYRFRGGVANPVINILPIDALKGLIVIKPSDPDYCRDWAGFNWFNFELGDPVFMDGFIGTQGVWLGIFRGFDGGRVIIQEVSEIKE